MKEIFRPSGPRPSYSLEEAAGLARGLYGIAGEVRELPSERDQNFYLKTPNGQEFVLKISAAAERGDLLEFQNAVLNRLSADNPDLVFQKVIPSLSGKAIEESLDASGSRHFVRLLSFLPGRLLSQVIPHKAELLRSLGRFLGRLGRSLDKIDSPLPPRELKWDMRRAPETVRLLLPWVEDGARRDIVNRFLDVYEEYALPLLPRLRIGTLYNDANDNNILVGAGSPDIFGRFAAVSGTIDFGDMVQGWRVVDPAIGAAYAMLDKPDPLAAAAEVVAGFNDVFPLLEPEVACLYPFMIMRLCLSVSISAEQQRKERDNEYLRISERPAWDCLARLLQIHPRLAIYTMREACGFSACPRTAEIVSWLKLNRDKLGPAIEPDLKLSPPLIIDLGAGGGDLGHLSFGDDGPEVAKLIFDRMAAAGKRVAVGRYDEARTGYTSPTFMIEGNDGPEPRTVHLGIDLFLPPGTAVLAPFDGTVHSFRDNASPQDYGPTIILEHDIPGGPKFYTLYGHLSRPSLDPLKAGWAVHRGEKIAEIGSPDVNGGWPPHLHFQVITDMLGREGDFPGVARPSRRSLWTSLCPDPNLILGMPEEGLFPSGKTGEKILEMRRRTLSPALSVSYRRPLKIVRGFRQYLYDADGRPYLDSVNNVAHVGHTHPRVVEAIRKQAAVLNTNTRYLHDNIVEYARRLAEKLPPPLGVFFFVNSGSEANDLALRLASSHTGRKDVIVLEGAYHGNLSSTIDISPYKFDGPGGKGSPPHVHKVLTPDIYRGPFRAADPEAGRKYAGHVEEALAVLRAQDRGPAAFIHESLLSCAGQIVLPAGFLQAAYKAVRAAGGVCIADEVQVGFGRVGTHFWGFETQGVSPDIVTMGKPIGNGHPLGAVVTTPEIAASFRTGMEYFNTYGGNPVSCAAGLAVLDVIEEEGLQRNALEVGARLKAGLDGLKFKHPQIGDVRGLGLFLGVEFVRNRVTLDPAGEEAAYIAERMRDKGILVSTDGLHHNVIKIKPPLVYTMTNADLFIATLDLVLAEDALLYE